jgi:uncharacterized protein
VTRKLIKTIEEFAQRALQGSDRGAHTYEHTLRVRQLCRVLGQEENADLEILEAAALLHDIGRPEEAKSGVSHAKIGAEMAIAFLATTSFPKDKLSAVASAIQTHRYSEQLTPESLEGEILSDADKLDAMGAIGLARTIAENLVRKRGLLGTIEHIDRKLLKLKDRMITETGKRIAQKRHELLCRFMKHLAQEFTLIGEHIPVELQRFLQK